MVRNSYFARGLLAVVVCLSGSPQAALIAAEQQPPLATEIPPAVDRQVDFKKEVQPILEQGCYKCHSATKRKGGLALSNRKDAFNGGDSGVAFVPRKSAESRLIRFVAGTDPDVVMPPKGERLTAEQVGILRAWIDQGAVWPDDADAAEPIHWAFQPIVRPNIPTVKAVGWVRNPIDSFILATLESKNLPASAEAGRGKLIRRLKLDLLGLPPTPEEIDAFVNDKRPDAYELLVNKYLDSPHYGERWGRHWLDVARYADSAGYESDFPRTAWYYRDWVINAVNKDMPFDRFVVEQIAGDLMPDATLDTQVATAFHANNEFDAGVRSDAVLERVNTTGVAFLGLTVGCAQCHNHKTDPISNREYYQLYAFFNAADITNLVSVMPEQVEKRQDLQAKLQGITNELAALELQLTNETSLAEWETKLKDEERAELPVTARKIFTIPREQRSEEEKKSLVTARLGADSQRKELRKKEGEVKDQLVKLPIMPVMIDKPRETHVFIRGNPEREGDKVQPSTPAFLPAIKKNGALTRLDLGNWIVSPENPLTARVAMNRVWMNYFGLGLVETENDFGVQTPPPSHPELLDWLASEFMARKWSFKAMHRLIVGSSTYRQSSLRRPDLELNDPQNRLLARQQRLRLEAEIVRDASLGVSGLLSPKIGGPSAFPYQPPGIIEAQAGKAKWVMSEGEERYRRGMYTWFWRMTPHPFLTLFDAPESNTTCTRRSRSNTPVQALTLLNDPSFVECAKALADRVLKQHPSDVSAGVRYLVRLCLGREPKQPEQEILCNLISRLLEDFSTGPEEAEKIADKMCPTNVEVTRFAAWTVASRAILNLDEFITRE